jgi:hypothetical protein
LSASCFAAGGAERLGSIITTKFSLLSSRRLAPFRVRQNFERATAKEKKLFTD